MTVGLSHDAFDTWPLGWQAGPMNIVWTVKTGQVLREEVVTFE